MLAHGGMLENPLHAAFLFGQNRARQAAPPPRARTRETPTQACQRSPHLLTSCCPLASASLPSYSSSGVGGAGASPPAPAASCWSAASCEHAAELSRACDGPESAARWRSMLLRLYLPLAAAGGISIDGTGSACGQCGAGSGCASAAALCTMLGGRPGSDVLRGAVGDVGDGGRGRRRKGWR
eukprot:365509-Chlamydomonas_euryale.AAC.21